jgi:cytidine deaminase
MSSGDPFSSTDQRPEMVFALVGAAGTRLSDLSAELKVELLTFGYQTVNIRLSALLPSFSEFTAQIGTGEYERITHYQQMGDAFRKRLQRGDAMALAGIAQIRAERAKISGNQDRPASAYAYVVHQLKHPDEVDLLRKIYGPSFLLLAGHAPRQLCTDELARLMARSQAQPGQEDKFTGKASEVITTDTREEDDEFGQNVRDTYPKADFFANLGIERGEYEVRRFVDLLFGHPFHTPSPDEYAMYQANAVSLRSSDDNRQVGAVIVNLSRDEKGKIKNADIIAVGMNEVPRGGGGFYWDQDSPDYRDQRLLQRGEDRAREIKVSALAELIKKIRLQQWLDGTTLNRSEISLAAELLPNLKGTQFLDIGEFSRPVHAEMAALIDAARRGVAVDSRSMYVTTFPCHNCAKHIIAAGIRRVVYLEPYPKSRARNLHGEEMVQESLSGGEEEGKVVFFAFTGIAPRQYGQLFSMSQRGAKRGRSLNKWNDDRKSLSPMCIPENASLMYLEAERSALGNLPSDIYNRETIDSNK